MRQAKFTIDNETLQESSEILRAIAHPLRMKILEFIDRNESINVNKIYNTLKLEQSITSQHLRILRMAGIVETEREGKYIRYRVAYNKVSRILHAVQKFLYTGAETEESAPKEG